MALIDPLERASHVGTELARTPLRVLNLLADPVRRDLQRDVRHALGAPQSPPISMSPDDAYLHPAAIARRVHSDVASMVIGGLSALFLQTLHPLTMAGVADHSTYADDPIGRLKRTASFVTYTTFGTAAEARSAIEQVRVVHRRVRGIAPDGRPYSAGDPDLVTWVHTAEVSSFLRSAQRFGAVGLDAAQCDRYLSETSAVAYELGAKWVPSSRDEVDAYFQRVRPQLYFGKQAQAARNFLIRGVGRKPEDRAVYTLIVAAAVSLLPGWARRELRLPNPPLVDRGVVAPLGRFLCSTIRWAVPPAESPFQEET